MNISVTDARPLFRTAVIATYRERIHPLAFLRSWFINKESVSKTVSLEVQRSGEQVATDVLRGSEGNRNDFGLSTFKQFLPPYFREFFDATVLDLYDQMFGDMNGVVADDVFQQFVMDVADQMVMLTDKIERAYELQCSQVLQTGIVTLKNGDNIDYKRKAASMINSNTAGYGYWTTNSVDPKVVIEAGCDFIRQVGKGQGGIMTMIAGTEAWRALKNNSIFKDANNLINMKLDAIQPNQRNALGGVLKGRVEAGSYDVNTFTYNEVYDTKLATALPYVGPKNIIIIPETPQFLMAFAAVPRLLKAGGGASGSVKGAFTFNEYLDEANDQHKMDVKSAGIAIPKAVDQIFTAQVVA